MHCRTHDQIKGYHHTSIRSKSLLRPLNETIGVGQITTHSAVARTPKQRTKTQHLIQSNIVISVKVGSSIVQAMAIEPIERKLDFVNDKGEKLAGILLDTGSPNVVLMCHGYLSNRNSCRFGEIASALADVGMSSFRFDHANSLFGLSKRTGPFRMGNHAEEVSDIHHAVQLLQNQGKTVTCLLGHSKGGTNVLKYAAEWGDVPRVINLAGRFRVQDGLEQRFGKGILERLRNSPEGIPRKEPFGLEWVMTLDDFEERATLPTGSFAAKIKETGKVKMLCLHGREDKTIPYQESIECAELCRSEVEVISGDHNFTKDEDAAIMISRVVAFCTSG
eukprot:jgi/Picsp_1/990/NSC_04474-R1_esterase lipase thioesterase family protein